MSEPEKMSEMFENLNEKKSKTLIYLLLAAIVAFGMIIAYKMGLKHSSMAFWDSCGEVLKMCFI